MEILLCVIAASLIAAVVLYLRRSRRDAS